MFTEPFITQLSQLSGGVSGGSAAGAIGGAGAVASGTVPSSGAVGGNTKPLPLNQRLQLQREPWFHGAISRKEAEMLLVQVLYINYPVDFLEDNSVFYVKFLKVVHSLTFLCCFYVGKQT